MDNLAREQCKRFDREAVYPANRSILEYWLSLHRDGALPLRADFDPRHIRQSLSKLMLIQVWPRERVVGRLAGTGIVRMIGRDLTGCDIIANTAPEFRRERAAIKLMAEGMIRVDPLISAVAPLAEGAEWFGRLYRREPNLMKVILRP